MRTSIKWILGIAANALELLNWRQRRKRREELKKPQQEAEEAVEEVRRNDEDAVNERLQHIFRPRGGGEPPGFADWRVPVALAIVALAFLFGCVRVKTKVVRVPANQCVVHLSVDGQDGYFVPTDMMEAIMYRLTLHAYKDDLEEQRLDASREVVPIGDAP